METVHVEINREVAERMQAEAHAQGRSLGELMSAVAGAWLEEESWLRAEIQRGLDDVAAGRLLGHEEMRARLRRLGAHVG